MQYSSGWLSASWMRSCDNTVSPSPRETSYEHEMHFALTTLWYPNPNISRLSVIHLRLSYLLSPTVTHG